MSNADGKTPDPNELNLPDDEQGIEIPDPLGDLDDLDLTEASAPTEESKELLSDFETIADEAGPMEEQLEASDVEISQEEEAEAPKEGKKGKKAAKAKKEKKAKKPKKSATASEGTGLGLAGMAALGFCALSIVVLLAMNFMSFMGHGFLFLLLINVFWLMATAIPLAMWLGRKTLNFYEVILGISLAGIIIAVSLLAAEVLVEYEGEVSPSGASAMGHSSAQTTSVVV